jgi:predicted DNA-binding transcriptional regulator AlpA
MSNPLNLIDIPKIYRMVEVAKALGVTRQHAYALIAKGAIPRGRRLAENSRPYWLASDIESVLRQTGATVIHKAA